MRRHHHDGLMAGDELTMAAVVPLWSRFTAPEQLRLTADTDAILGSKRWEAANGFELTRGMRVTIAAQAAVLVLGLQLDAYRHVRTIVVHPTTMIRTGQRAGPVRGVVSDGPLPLLGEAAHDDGPVSIAWDSLVNEARHPETGHNVVFHEFAHKIDMLDGLVDGTPPMPVGPDRDRWIAVCTELFDRLRRGDTTVLRPYAAVSPGEFFAVATEVFFTIPRELAAAEPSLYGVLRSYYRQDPGAIGDLSRA